jgi:hypothetical protein
MNTKLGLLAAAGLGLAALAFSQPAAAQAAFGSASFNTYRTCGTATLAQPCDGTGAGQNIAASAITGGVSSTANTVLSRPDGSFANSTVTFGAFDLPVVNGATLAVGNERMNVNAFGYQTYTYTGAADTLFALTGSLHIVDSSTSGVPDDNSDPANPINGGIFPNGAIGVAYVGVWDTSILGAFTDAQSIFDNLFLAPCGTGGVLATGLINQNLSGGETTLSATTSSCSGGGALTLTPGETVLVVAGMQLPVNRGGFIDATHTFTTAFAPDLGINTADLHSGESILGVPEPTTWALMLTGFLGLGTALRRRRAALAA